MFLAFPVEVCHTVDPPIVADTDPGGHGMGAYLGAVHQRVRNVGDQSAGFGAHLTTLETETTIDTMRAVAMRCGENRHGSAGNRAQAHFCAASYEHVAYSAERMRSIGVP